MRLATYNVENMFDRAKALNQENWAEGRPALEAHRALNALFNKTTYSAADKQKMLTLLESQGLLKKDEGPFLLIRKIRGKLLKRPNSGSVTVEATGRADWLGWVELKTEHVSERATGELRACHRRDCARHPGRRRGRGPNDARSLQQTRPAGRRSRSL